MCECGYTREQHLEEATRPHAFQGKEWDPKKHVQEMPTDAFGDIVFTGLGQKVGKVGFHGDSVALTVDQSPLWVTEVAGTPWGRSGRLAETWGRAHLPSTEGGVGGARMANGRHAVPSGSRQGHCWCSAGCGQGGPDGFCHCQEGVGGGGREGSGEDLEDRVRPRSRGESPASGGRGPRPAREHEGREGGSSRRPRPR